MLLLLKDVTQYRLSRSFSLLICPTLCDFHRKGGAAGLPKPGHLSDEHGARRSSLPRRNRNCYPVYCSSPSLLLFLDVVIKMSVPGVVLSPMPMPQAIIQHSHSSSPLTHSCIHKRKSIVSLFLLASLDSLIHPRRFPETCCRLKNILPQNRARCNSKHHHPVSLLESCEVT